MSTFQEFADRQLWQSARSLAELGHLTAAWLEGAISFLPAYGRGPDGKIRPAQETKSLIPHLARANRHGFVTVTSQPGVKMVDGCGQRAYVDGFCSAETAVRIQAACQGTDLVAVLTPPTWENPTKIPVSIVDGKECTWVGAATPMVDIAAFYGEDTPRALASLFIACQIAIVDPVWGRAELLWERLDSAWE